MCCNLRGMSPLTRLALRVVTRIDVSKLTAAELDEWTPALQDVADDMEGQRHQHAN